ncbi:hypothetical protein HPP92_027512 [Vanilla planifolia]|uniref:Uncharacterized protein n=1 Tax=Vanilla planifolia TaxID=51239 RepID=A0A835U5Z3_VANPL|nr:hypothetical protein HPP92_027512 [Vanilla planifolia]
MKAANTPTSRGRGSANHGRGRGSMATSGSAAHGHVARDCPKVSDMKAANTPTSRGRGSANHGRGRGSMATSGSAAHGLQYNQAKERSESGNMDKGNGKEQQGDTQQELAQTLVSLLRSIGGTSNQVTEASIDLVVDQFQRMHPPYFLWRGRSNDSLRTG